MIINDVFLDRISVLVILVLDIRLLIYLLQVLISRQDRIHMMTHPETLR